MTTDGTPSKPPRRPRAKPASHQDVQKVKVTLYLAADLAKRFAIHAEMIDLDKSELFAEMVRGYCKRFVVHDRDKGPGETAEQGAA